jgi:hypothetical protein
VKYNINLSNIDEGIAMKFNSHDGFSRADQERAKN